MLRLVCDVHGFVEIGWIEPQLSHMMPCLVALLSCILVLRCHSFFHLQSFNQFHSVLLSDFMNQAPVGILFVFLVRASFYCSSSITCSFSIFLLNFLLVFIVVNWHESVFNQAYVIGHRFSLQDLVLFSFMCHFFFFSSEVHSFVVCFPAHSAPLSVHRSWHSRRAIL
jgi:hypothetical protein